MRSTPRVTVLKRLHSPRRVVTKPTPSKWSERKAELEVLKLESELKEQSRPFWRRREFMGLQGSLLAGVLATLATAVTGFWAAAERVEDDVRRKAVEDVVAELATPDTTLRLGAGHRLSRLDSRFNLPALRRAYDKSLFEAQLDPRESARRTPFLRVGAVEAVGRGPSEWKAPVADLRDFLLGAPRRDPSPLVRYKAATALATPAFAAHEDLQSFLDQEARALNVPANRDSDGWVNVVRIPEGRYVVGSDDGTHRAINAREIDLPEFWIDAKPVSNHQWVEAMRAGWAQAPAIEAWANEAQKTLMATTRTRHPDKPVLGVSFDQAATFCKLSGDRRLPTEWEWEVAARGKSGWRFPWGVTVGLGEDFLRNESSINGEARQAGASSIFTYVQRL